MDKKILVCKSDKTYEIVAYKEDMLLDYWGNENTASQFKHIPCFNKKSYLGFTWNKQVQDEVKQIATKYSVDIRNIYGIITYKKTS